MKCSGRNGVFLRVIQEHRVPEEEASVEWVPREPGEGVQEYHKRALGVAGERAMARRLGGGACFGVVGTATGGKNRGAWRVRFVPTCWCEADL
eukprot:11719823-Alexandrium_andersonii.AAC.1